VRKRLPQLVIRFAEILTALKVPPPFRWIAGIEGVEGYLLAFDQHNGYQYGRPAILTDPILSEGLHSPGDEVSIIVDAFSKKVFAECAREQPQDII
jgi:hypothetical protein